MGQDIKKDGENVPVFFTAGSGMQPENVNPGIDESLNTSSFPEQTEPDFGRVGNIAISGELVEPPEQIELTAEEVEFKAPEMPKSPFEIVSEKQPTPVSESPADNVVDFNLLKVGRNDHLTSVARKALSKGVKQFEHGEISPANLVDLRWAASKAYLKNSYDRKIGETA